MEHTQRNRVGFIGAGRMATALAKGFLGQKAVTQENLLACDVWEPSRIAFTEVTGVACAAESKTVIEQSDVLFLAVKPQVVKDVCSEIAQHAKADQLVVSIAAGVTLTQLGKYLGNHRQLIRIMPNTPCLVGAGAAGMAAAGSVCQADRDFIRTLLETVGICLEVPEKLMDAVTGLSGSGPAYIFQLIEAMSDAGVMTGLPRETATKLAAQTVLGSARMVLETGQHPGALKDAVTSPGGTTIAGIAALERGGFRAAMIDAVEAATARSQELSNQ